MALQVYSARISHSGADTFNVTRQSGKGDGLAFAPSKQLLFPWLAMRKKARAAEEYARLFEDVRALEDIEAEQVKLFEAYRASYVAEMRDSYKWNRPAWLRLLLRPRVVLVCYCTNGTRCHRGILRAEILPRLGAQNLGELA